MSRNTTNQKLLAVALFSLAGIGAVALLRGRSHDEADSKTRTVNPSEVKASSEARETRETADGPSASAKDPRMVLRRPWFDRYPKSRRDEIELWWFSSAGFGVHEKGSLWRSTIDFFDFERQGSKLDVTFFQDKKKEAVRFEVIACDDAPPFDLCLDLKEPLRGKKRLYSFGDDEEMDAHVPWAREWRTSADARARASR